MTVRATAQVKACAKQSYTLGFQEDKIEKSHVDPATEYLHYFWRQLGHIWEKELHDPGWHNRDLITHEVYPKHNYCWLK